MPIRSNNFDRIIGNTDAADRAALTTMGLACLQVAQPNCPVRTGNLRRSHRSNVSGDHVDIGVTAEYGGYVHNGTSTRRAKPWLKTAVQRNKTSITEAGVRAWQGAIR